MSNATDTKPARPTNMRVVQAGDALFEIRATNAQGFGYLVCRVTDAPTARLIAAAPEMLEVLHAAEIALAGFPKNRCAVDAARRVRVAIFKAEQPA